MELQLYCQLVLYLSGRVLTLSLLIKEFKDIIFISLALKRVARLGLPLLDISFLTSIFGALNAWDRMDQVAVAHGTLNPIISDQFLTFGLTSFSVLLKMNIRLESTSQVV